MTKDEALKLAMDFVASISPAFICEATHHKKNERHADNEPCPHVKKQKQTYEAIKKALANEALEKKAENARELGLNYEPEPMTETMRQMLEVQGQHGNWNYDSYMHGLYNGMEYMVALAEKREPKFRDAPKIWLAKYEVKRDNFNNTEPLTEVTPPQRTWVGLTEAQCGVLWKTNMTPFEYYQAIEAKLRSKNT